MNPTRLTHKRTLSTSIATLLVASVSAQAALSTWNAFGTGPFQWSAGGSWVGAVAPAVGDATLDVLFPAGGGATATNNDFAGLFLNSLTFSGGAAETVSISGNSLDFRTDGATPTLTQNGVAGVTVSAPIVATNALTLNGTGSGITTLTGLISGAGGITATAGNWRLGSAASNFTGGLTVGTGAFVDVGPVGAAPQSVNITVGAATILGGTGNAVTINGGTLKLTTTGAGTISLGTARPIVFGASGGTFDITNTNTPGAQGGNISGGDLGLTLSNTAGNTAVIKFNGGQLGLSNNSATDPNWIVGTNALRLGAVSGAGALRLELTNGAMARASLAAGGTDAANTYGNAMTVRGVVGGDPTSGSVGTTHPGISLTTGRYMIDSARVTYNGGLTLEGALQIVPNGRASALVGNITVGGNGYVAFGGRSTGTALSNVINAPGVTTAGQNVTWVGESASTTFTVQNGGIAVFDGRIRSDQNNTHGVLLGGNAVLNAGGTLRIAQSLSNFSNITPLTAQNVGDIILRGSITGQGSSASDSVLDIKLPAPDASGTIANGVPIPLAATAPTGRVYVGLVAEAAHSIIVNGVGFGGLRVNATARPDRIFSATGVAGGAAIPDPTSNATKINAYLTATRLAAITGSGGYITPAPTGVTFNFPAAGEWNVAQPVGLRVADNNGAGVDVSLSAISTFAHHIAVDSAAILDTGAGAFSLTAGRLHGSGTVSGAGGVTIGASAGVEPGLGGIGSLTVANLTLNGTLYLNVSNTGATDILNAANLTLGGASVLTINGGSTFNNAAYTVVNYSGALSGAFATASGLPVGYGVDYAMPNVVRLVYSASTTRTWAGTPGTLWSTAGGNANWQGGVAFSDTDGVIFNDTATTTSPVVSGTVQPSAITFNHTGNYLLSTTGGGAIAGPAALEKSGSGTLEISGAHTYGGGTNINGGTLKLGDNNVLPNTGVVTVAVGATLDVNGKSDTIGDLILNGSATAGTLTVGALTVGPGVGASTAFVLGGNVTRNAGADSTLSGSVDLGGAVRSFTVASGGANDLTVSGAISNGSITKLGAGVLRLSSGANTQTTTTVSAGTLKSSAAGAIPAGSSVTVGAAGALDFAAVAQSIGALDNSGTVTTGGAALSVTSLAGGGSIQMGGGALAIAQTGATTFSGAISGTGTVVTKSGAGVLTLTGSSTFDGGLNITGGRVNTSATGGGTGGITASTNGILQLSAPVTGNVTLSGGTVSAAVNLGNIATGTLNVAAPSFIHLYDESAPATKKDIIIASVFSGSGDILVSISGQDNSTDGGNGLRFRGPLTNTYSGTITAGQGAKLESQSAGGSGSSAGTAKFILTAGTVTGALNGTYSQFQSRVTVDNAIATMAHNFEAAGSGVVNLNVIGNAGTTTNFGDLKFGAGQSVFFNKNDATIRSVNFSTVTLTGGNATLSVLDPSFGSTAGAVGANVGLGAIGETVAGSGITFKAVAASSHATINGASTYTGVTDIETGTLTIGASGSISGSSRVEISAGAKLDVLPFGASGYAIPAAQKVNGTGDWDGRLVLDGTLAPGNSIGTLTGDDFTLNGAGVMQFELSTVDNTSDRLTLSGALTKGSAGAYLFDFEGGGQNLVGPTTVYTLVQFASTDFSASDFTYTDLAPGLTATFNQTATELQLIVVPEPGSATFLLGGLAMLAARRRRK